MGSVDEPTQGTHQLVASVLIVLNEIHEEEEKCLSATDGAFHLSEVPR